MMVIEFSAPGSEESRGSSASSGTSRPLGVAELPVSDAVGRSAQQTVSVAIVPQRPGRVVGCCMPG